MLLMKESVLSFEENIIFDEFSICLFGYRIEFSCLYRPQGHHFISTVWLLSADEYVHF